MKFIQFFWILNINFKKIFYIIIFIVVFMKSSLNLDLFSAQIKTLTRTFCHIAHPNKSLKSQYIRNDYSLFLSQSIMYLLLGFTY